METNHPLLTKIKVRLQELGKIKDELYLLRVKKECDEIEKQGLWDYFSGILERKEKYENENNLLISYLLGISEEDPLAGEEKPLSWIESNDFPDIDTDFLPGDRDPLKDWIAQRFGQDRVCSICNYSTYRTKSALKDVSRVFEVPLGEVNELTTKMDDDVNKISWVLAVDRYPKLKLFEKKYPEVCEIVQRLLGRHFRLGKHAAGVVIADRPLTDIVPLVQRNGKVMSAWAEGQATSDLKTVGLVKFDILGLDNLEYIKTTKELVSDIWRKIVFECGTTIELERYKALGDKIVDELNPGDVVKIGKHTKRIVSIEAVEIDFDSEDYLADKKSLEMANRGDLIGVFQFDSRGIRELTKQIGVTEFEDLVSATCLYRPGPLDSGMARDFIKRRKNDEAYELHPILESIMGKTEGIALYQEQTMQIFNKVGGISLPNCEKIRKAMGQKRVSEFLKFKEEFLETGSRRLGLIKTKMQAEKQHRNPEDTVEAFWEKIEKSSGYLFNRSHGVVYTIVSMQCLYLKAHYPREYFAAVLSNLETSDNRRSIYMREAIKCGVEFVPVNINNSKLGFTIADDGRIYFGFDKIKGIGAQAGKIVDGQPYASFEDFLDRFGLGKTVCEALIKLGAFDDFMENRKPLWEFFMASRGEIKKKPPRDVVFDIGLALKSFQEMIDREKSGEKIKRAELKAQPIVINPNCDPFSMQEISGFEDKYYGLFFNHPLSFRRKIGYTTDLIKEEGKLEVYIADIKQKKTRTGSPYYILITEDENGTQSVIVWDDQYNSFSELLKPGECVYLEVDPPGKYPTANLKKDSIPRRLRCLDEQSEEDELSDRLDNDYERSIQSLQSIRDAMEFSLDGEIDDL